MFSSRKSNSKKIAYYAKNLAISLTPRVFFQRAAWLARLDKNNREELICRLNYYNQLDEKFEPGDDFQAIRDYKYTGRSTYFFDLNRFLKYYPSDLKFSYLFGDVLEVPENPKFVKSRPISETNQNSILMKLNKDRHFTFVDDQIPFEAKKDMAVWRGAAYREKRKNFIQNCYEMDCCDFGQTNQPPLEVPWQKEFMSRDEQLKYKFILSVEGNDVATNLKWIMSSNSLCMMTTPEYETWFMEGRLIPDHHYVHLQPDYSDLEEKLRYYTDNPDEAQAIIQNAHEYVKQFLNDKQEHLLSLLVLEKYFHQSGQINSPLFEKLAK